jgi:hypothetical protein
VNGTEHYRSYWKEMEDMVPGDRLMSLHDVPMTDPSFFKFQ